MNEFIGQMKHSSLTHEASWVVSVSADLAVHLDKPLHDDLGHLRVGQSVLEPVTKENDHGQRFPQFVGTSAGSGSKNTSQLVQHP